MAWLPLTDTTEARYAEIARKMLETGDWVTLQHDYAIPFWGKPPLSTWLSAISMAVFGQNEFAVRLPSLLLSFATLWLIGSLVRSRHGSEAALAAVLMLASSVLFFVAAGAVMTDSALVFCTTLIQVAFWRAICDDKRIWAYVFFVGVGLGLLAKGPIALVLTGMPIFFWVLIQQQWRPLWQRLPWISGTLLALLIAAPWYVWAEWRTPGFLNYFIIGEHIQRFLEPGWAGDKYGFAHSTPRGMIWLYAFGALLPWAVALPVWLWRARKQPQQVAVKDGWLSYLLLWACMPLVFFTLSSNIIFPYALPALPGACVLIAEYWYRARQPAAACRLPWIAGFTVVIGLILLALQATAGDRLIRTQKALVAQWQALQPAADSQLYYWSKRREFSSEFYSGGRSRATDDLEQLQRYLNEPSRGFVVIEAEDLVELPELLQEQLEELAKVEVKGKQMLILGERTPTNYP